MSGASLLRRMIPAALLFVLFLLPAVFTVAQEPPPAVATPQPPGGTPVSTPPAFAGTRSTATPAPTTPLELLFTDSFDDENYTANFWTFGAGWEQTSIIGRGQVLEVSESESPATLIHAPLTDVVVEARFLVRSGAARLTVRESDRNGYTVDLDRRGQARLYENNSVLDSGMVSRFAPVQWHTLRLSAIGGILQAWVDGQLILEAQDSTPLPAGAISFAGRDLRRNSLRVDDFALWIPIQTAPTATPTASPVDLPAEPQLQMIFEDNFGDAGITDGMWTLDGWQRGLNGEEWVLGSTGNASAIFANSQLDDFAAQLRYLSSAGVVQVHLRQGETEAYTVAIRADGRVSLLRGNRSLGTALVVDYASEEWHALWFSVIEDMIRVGIDYEQIIATQDNSPLLAGGVAIEGSAPAGETLLVDDFALWIPVMEEAQSEPRMMAAASTESLYWDFNGQNYAGWYSGAPGETSYWASSSPFYRSGYPGCQHALIRTNAGYEGLAGRGSWFGGWTSECRTGWALNGVIDLGQSYLVSNVTYARYTKFEGLGRTYGILLRNEAFQAVRGPVWYTIAGTNYATHSHNLPTPSYVRYVQVLGNTSGSYNVIFDWVQLNYTPPTPTPSPTPTATPTQLPITATCPTITANDATYFAGPDLAAMPVNVLIAGTGIDLMGIYINGGWYAIRRYSSPEGGAMGMRAAAVESEAIEGWIQAEDVVLTGEDGLPLPCLVDIPEVDENGNVVEGTLTPTPSPTPEPLPTCAVNTLHDTGVGVNMRPGPGIMTSIVHTYTTPTNLTAQGWREDTNGVQWIYVWNSDSSEYGWIRHDLLSGLILTPDGGCADLRRVTLDGQTEDRFGSLYDYDLPNPATDPWNSPYTCSGEDSNEAREGCAQVTYTAFYNGFSSAERFGRAPRLSDLLNRILRLEVGTVLEANASLAGRVLKNNYWQIVYGNSGCDEDGCNEEVIVSQWLSGVQSLYKYGNPDGSSEPLPGFEEWFLNPPRYQVGVVYALSDSTFEGCLSRGGTGPCEWGNYGFIDNNLRPPDLPNTYQEIMSGTHADNTFYCYVRRAYFDNDPNGGVPNPTENDVWVDEIFAVTGPTVGKTWTFEMLINGQLNQPPWLLVTTKETVNGRLITTYGAGYRRGAIEEINTNAVITPCPANAE